MTCWHPLKAYRTLEVNPETGRRGITFTATKSYVGATSISVPCGRCTGCRIDRSRQWAMRCLHEASLYPENCFITLTYDQQNVPDSFGLQLRDLQLFMKRLRKKFSTKTIRFFACGEYGDENLRPHYHALLFNHDFSDKKYFTTRNSNKIYNSQILNDIWQKSEINEIGDVSFKSAAYCARYTLKKQNGDRADPHYYRQSPVNGEYYRIDPEFAVMSRRPGIGDGWFNKYKSDCFPSDYLIIEGKKVGVPAYYTRKLADQGERLLKPKEVNLKTNVKRSRKRAMLKQKADSTPDRLKVREAVQLSRITRLRRTL